MNIKKALIILGSILILFTGAQKVLASYGLSQTAGTAGLSTSGSVSGITGNIIGSILTMVGVLFLVLMIYGGIIWMLARGNEQQSKKALDTIIAAVIGLVIVLGSYAITNFVFSGVQEKPTTVIAGSCVDLNTPAALAAGCATVTCGDFTSSAGCSTDTDCCIWQEQ